MYNEVSASLKSCKYSCYISIKMHEVSNQGVNFVNL